MTTELEILKEKRDLLISLRNEVEIQIAKLGKKPIQFAIGDMVRTKPMRVTMVDSYPTFPIEVTHQCGEEDCFNADQLELVP